MFLVFISGFGTQSRHLVTVMEQSISARLYKGLEGGGRWTQTDPYPEERDSFHYRTAEKKEGENKNQRRGERRAGVHFIIEPQSRNLSP